MSGEDLSVTEGEKFTWKINSVVDDKTNLKISWTATYNGARRESVQHHCDRERAGVLSRSGRIPRARAH